MSAGAPKFSTVHGGDPPRSPALAKLLDAVQREANGEFLCACREGEFHVYLQGGRIAWATDSKHRRAFTQHLKQSAGVDEASIEAVVSDCRRTRRPLGEALVTWKLATRDQVRGALRHQIEEALKMVDAPGECQAMFLQRDQYERYDPGLTFPLAELLPGLVASEPPERPLAAPERVVAPRLERAPPPPPPAAEARDPAEDAVIIEAVKGVRDIEGFVGAAVLAPGGERLTILARHSHHLESVRELANALLLSAQEMARALGIGRGQLAHVEGEQAHILVSCLNEGAGRAHVHLVLILTSDAPIGLAKLRMSAVADQLADALAGGRSGPAEAGELHPPHRRTTSPAPDPRP
jgi:predicted regulator of Ras-like GTPase activity (Roadblock/LC7/MglB family)